MRCYNIDDKTGACFLNTAGYLASAGKTKCSGRFLAKYFVTTFVATLLRRYDIQAVGDPPMPQPDVRRPVLGIISVGEGQDYVVCISERKGL